MMKPPDGVIRRRAVLRRGESYSNRPACILFASGFGGGRDGAADGVSDAYKKGYRPMRRGMIAVRPNLQAAGGV